MITRSRTVRRRDDGISTVEYSLLLLTALVIVIAIAMMVGVMLHRADQVPCQDGSSGHLPGGAAQPGCPP